MDNRELKKAAKLHPETLKSRNLVLAIVFIWIPLAIVFMVVFVPIGIPLFLLAPFVLLSNLIAYWITKSRMKKLISEVGIEEAYKYRPGKYSRFMPKQYREERPKKDKQAVAEYKSKMKQMRNEQMQQQYQERQVKSTTSNSNIADNPVVNAAAAYGVGKAVLDAGKKKNGGSKLSHNPYVDRNMAAQKSANENRLSNRVPASRKCCGTCQYWDGRRTVIGNGRDKKVQLPSTAERGHCKKLSLSKNAGQSCNNNWCGM